MFVEVKNMKLVCGAEIHHKGLGYAILNVISMSSDIDVSIVNNDKVIITDVNGEESEIEFKPETNQEKTLFSKGELHLLYNHDHKLIFILASPEMWNTIVYRSMKVIEK